VPVLPEHRIELATPFYLKMMRLNALEYGADLLPEIAKKGALLDAADVIELLRDSWRLTVMGAWFALLHDDAAVTAAVLDALEASAGSLTSPPLAVTAVVLAGRNAIPALEAYAASDDANGWGACGFAAAAAKYLGGSVGCGRSDTNADTEDFDAMLALAQRLRAAR
jgi:hypothetical protein